MFQGRLYSLNPKTISEVKNLLNINCGTFVSVGMLSPGSEFCVVSIMNQLDDNNILESFKHALQEFQRIMKNCPSSLTRDSSSFKISICLFLK